MPVTFFLSEEENEENAALRLSGNNFSDLLEQVKQTGLRFTDHWYDVDKVWVGSRSQIRKAIQNIQTVENIKVPSVIQEFIKPYYETQFYNHEIDYSLLKSDPLGEYQIEGIQKGICQNRFMLGWDMGTGKSFASISVLNHYFEWGWIDRLLILAPMESLINFKQELLMFSTFASEEDIQIASTNNRNPFEDYPDCKVVLSTYRTFLMMSDDCYYKNSKLTSRRKIPKKYRKPTIDFSQWGTSRAIILDESQNIKNRTARTSHVLNLHKRFFDFRYELSGTPAPKGTEDFYNQLYFLDEGIIDKDYYEWLSDIAVLGTRFSAWAVKFYKENRVESFVNDIKPWVSRINSEDVLDLPESILNRIYTYPTKKHNDIYKAFIESALQRIKEDDEDGELKPRAVQEKLNYLMQAVDDPCLIKTDELIGRVVGLAKKWKFEDHSFLDACSSALNSFIDQDGSKTILWSGHPGTMDRLAEYYSKYNPIVIHGHTGDKGDKVEIRNELLNKFKRNKDHPLLIASYRVLGRAVNIVEANRNIYWDRSWDYEHWSQSKKRTHRHGQTSRVVVSPLIMLGTISEALDKNLSGKEGVDRNLFKRDSLSQSEWKALFGGNGE